MTTNSFVATGLGCLQLVRFSPIVWKCSCRDASLTSHPRGLVSLRPPPHLALVRAQGALGCTVTDLGSKRILGDIFSSCGGLWSFTEINGLIEE